MKSKTFPHRFLNDYHFILAFYCFFWSIYVAYCSYILALNFCYICDIDFLLIFSISMWSRSYMRLACCVMACSYLMMFEAACRLYCSAMLAYSLEGWGAGWARACYWNHSFFVGAGWGGAGYGVGASIAAALPPVRSLDSSTGEAVAAVAGF